jgi:hypothetical protein
MPVPSPAIAAVEAVGGDHRDLGAAPAGFSTLGIGDARDRTRGFFRGADQRRQLRLARLLGIEDIELQRRLGDLARIGEAAIGIFRHRLRHGDRAVGELLERRTVEVAGGDDRLSLADENPQAHVLVFRARQLLQLAEPLAHREAEITPDHRVGCVGAGGFGEADGGFEQAGKIGIVRVGHDRLSLGGMAG